MRTQPVRRPTLRPPRAVLAGCAGAVGAPGAIPAPPAGTPQISGAGTMIPGEPVTVKLTNANANKLAHLTVGASQRLAPFKGGVLVPSPALMFLDVDTGAGGSVTVSSAWPTNVPCDVSSYCHWWSVDAGGPEGFAATLGLEQTMSRAGRC